jgi:hypothetical protein
MGLPHFHRNFGLGRALCALNFADAKFACAEIEREPLTAGQVRSG